MSALLNACKVDFRRLDIREMAQWPSLAKGLLCALLLLAVLVMGYGLHLRERLGQLEHLRAAESDLKQQFADKAGQAAHLALYREQMQGMQRALDELLRLLPRDAEVPGLLEDISRTGLDSGLAFEEIKLLPEVSGAFYLELPIQVTVLGTYHGLAAFVSAVSALPRIVTLHDLSLAPVNQPGGSVLRMSLLAQTYRYHGGLQP